MDAPQITLAIAASIGGGMMNAMAGGGTLLTYPALLFAGESAIIANATSSVALWPGAAASLYGYRREVSSHAGWLKLLFLPSLLGGAIGAALLLRTPAALFERMSPFLVLFATTLFMIQGAIARRRQDAPGGLRAKRLPLAWLLQLGIGIYGGYFGAGIGILMLAVLGFLGLGDIHAANGVKNFFGMCMNGVAAAWFILQGAVDWPVALLMIAGAIGGGYAGARWARRMGRGRARAAVVVIGLAVTVALLWRQLGG
jgi:uncharacterized membrane protein YfcA